VAVIPGFGRKGLAVVMGLSWADAAPARLVLCFIPPFWATVASEDLGLSDWEFVGGYQDRQSCQAP